MKKYFAIFKISWANELEYRFGFLLKRTRNIVFLLMFYYIWLKLSELTGKFAGYSTDELVTYVLGVHLLRAIIFGAQSRKVSEEINEGTLSTYLVRPVNYSLFVFFRELAQRAIFFASAILEIIIFLFLTKARFLLPENKDLGVLFLAMAGALILYFFLGFLVSLFAFWSREAYGPRFIFEWFLEFSSGAFFPLTILSAGFFALIQYLPFAYLMFYPMIIYLNKRDVFRPVKILALEIVWIGVIGVLTYFVWNRGLKRYSGEGI